MKFKKISEIMVPYVVTVAEHTPLKDFEKHFKRRDIHHIIVEKDGGEIVGIVSSEDVAKSKSWINEGRVLASHIMTKDVVTLSPDSKSEEAIEIFLSNRFRALPVIDSERKIVGIITPYDFLKLLHAGDYQTNLN